jgi:hypothetical protein
MMTIEQKLDIVRMRLEGEPLHVIAKKYGCSKQNICELLNRICNTERDTLRYRGWIFPNIAKWLVENKKTLLWVAETLDIHYATLCAWMTGKIKIRYDDMKKVAGLLDMSLSEAFEEREVKDR